MADLDHKLRGSLREESDDILFSGMEVNDQLKRRIRQQAVAEKQGKRRFTPAKSWVIGTVALAASVWMVAGFPLLQQPSIPTPVEDPAGNSLPPANGGAAGSDLSSLITTAVNSVEEAKTAFGSKLLTPSAVPAGFTLSEISIVGMKGDPARDAIFTYYAGDKTITFVASRMPAAFPAEMFTKTPVDGAEGYILEQQGLTELFWTEDGLQYSVTGQISGAEALSIAESLE